MEDNMSELQQANGAGKASVGLQEEDGYSREIRDLALNLVMRVPSAPAALRAASNDDRLAAVGEATIRLAEAKDIETICAFRCAQSMEYWGLSATEESHRLFRAETEAYVRRNLDKVVHFALVEVAGEAVSMSGLEIIDRMPAIGVRGGTERGATVVACYTLPQHRGKGYMSQMLSMWSALAPMLGVDAVYLESHNPSMQMLALDEGYDYVSEKYRLDLASLRRADSAVQLGAVGSVPEPAYLPAG